MGIFLLAISFGWMFFAYLWLKWSSWGKPFALTAFCFFPDRVYHPFILFRSHSPSWIHLSFSPLHHCILPHKLSALLTTSPAASNSSLFCLPHALSLLFDSIRPNNTLQSLLAIFFSPALADRSGRRSHQPWARPVQFQALSCPANCSALFGTPDWTGVFTTTAPFKSLPSPSRFSSSSSIPQQSNSTPVTGPVLSCH